MKKFLLSIALMASALISWADVVECTPGNLSNLVDNPSVEALTITGQMDARDFKFIADKLELLTSINLSGVEIVAYSNNKPLLNNEVRFPENSIPAMAFFGKKITQVTLPSNLKSIGMAAFAGCESLAEFNFPETLDSIAAYAFSDTQLSTVVLPEGLKHLGKGVFYNIPSLTSATIVTTNNIDIPESAFEYCSNLNTVNLGNINSIGERAFKGTTQLNSLNFTSGNNNLTYIGKEAFVGSALADFNFEEASGLQKVDEWAFAQSKQVSANLAATPQVKKGAFYYATDLTSFVANQTTDSIADLLLAGTAVGNDVTSNTQVSYIGRYAFYNSLPSKLSLPATLTFIGDRAMAGMINLMELSCDATEVPELGDEVWIGVKQPAIPLTVPRESHEAYMNALQWTRFLIQWEDGPEPVFGDVNQDGFVTAADITAIYNILLGMSTDYMETADVTGDGEITASDITAVYNVLLGNRKAPGRNQVVNDSNDKVNAQDFIIETGETHNMELQLNSSAEISAMQLDLLMPQGLSIENVTTTSRTSGMVMGFNEIEPGKWRVLIHSGNAMKDNEGDILNIIVKAGDDFGGNEFITINNIIAVEPSERTHLINEISVAVGTTTGVSDINASINDGPVDVYNLNGQLLRKQVERNEATQGLPAGIYIVGGKKVIVK